MALDKGGTVYGVGFDTVYMAKHKRVTNREQLKDLFGSKYVQSYVGDAFSRAKSDLENAVPVLFSGSPCQIAGLKKYLGKPYENLMTCDIVCHGVPSPEVYRNYLQWMEKKYSANATQVRFRDKKRSWKCFNMRINFDNGETYTGNCFDDPYHVGFLKNQFLQDCCYTCKYANMDRISDITMADFWDYFRDKSEPIDTDKGISLILSNTTKGEKMLMGAKKYLKLYEKEFSRVQATQPALNKPFEPSKNEAEFWNDYWTYGFDYVEKKYMSKGNSIEYYMNLYKYGFWGTQIKKRIDCLFKM